MKIESSSSPRNSTATDCGGKNVLGLLQEGNSCGGDSFASILPNHSNRDCSKETEAEGDRDKEEKDRESKIVPVHEEALLQMSDSQAQIPIQPAPTGIDVALASSEEPPPLIQSSSQICFRMGQVSDQSGTSSSATPVLAVEMTGAAFKAQLQQSTTATTTGKEGVEGQGEVPSLESIPSTATGDSSIKSKDEVLVGGNPANVAEVAVTDSNILTGKDLPSASKADEYKGGDSMQGVGTAGANAQPSMTPDPKTSAPKLASAPSEERSERVDLRVSMADEPVHEGGKDLGTGGNNGGTSRDSSSGNDQPSTFSIRGFEPSTPAAPASASATPVFSSQARFEPIFRALGDISDKMRREGPGKVEMELQLDSGEKIRVRLELHQGTVKATFRTETGDFQKALQQGWSSFSQQSADRGFSVSDATFETFSTEQQPNADQRESREHERERDASAHQAHVPGRFGNRTPAVHVAPTTISRESSSLSLWA